MAKIGPHTVDIFQLRAPNAFEADKKAVKSLILSSEVFSGFSEADRAAIWHKLRSCEACDCVIPSIHTFFRDISYLNVCADAVKRLAVLKTSSTPQSRKPWPTASGHVVPTRTVKSKHPRLHSVDSPVRLLTGKKTGYSQIWMYAMRWYPEMPKTNRATLSRPNPPAPRRTRTLSMIWPYLRRDWVSAPGKSRISRSYFLIGKLRGQPC